MLECHCMKIRNLKKSGNGQPSISTIHNKISKKQIKLAIYLVNLKNY